MQFDSSSRPATSVLAPYHSSNERERLLDGHAAALGGDVHVLGTSREGRPIRAVQVRATQTSSRALLVCAGIHGLEYIGTEVALGFLAALSTEPMRDLRARADLWVIPSLNPDAYERTWAANGHGTLKHLRANAAGVDLNRNYPLAGPLRPVISSFGGFRTGSDDPTSSFYRGPHPLSEPETAALDALAQRVHFVASANLHATMGALIVPCLRNASDAVGYRTLCDAFVRGQAHTRYRPIIAGSLDRFTGEQEDHQHHAYRTWSICVEHYPVWVDVKRALSRTLFWRYNPRDPARWVANDVPGIAAYLRAALEMAG